MRDLRILIENTKASFTNIIQEIEDRISGIEDSIEKNGYMSPRRC
jgi:Mg2+ and Co2+ transporter CorA